MFLGSGLKTSQKKNETHIKFPRFPVWGCISPPETYNGLIKTRLPFMDFDFGIHGFWDFGENENRSLGPKNGLFEYLVEATIVFRI